MTNFITMFESFFDRMFNDPFNSEFFLNLGNLDNLEEEVFEVVKGDYKTIIVCKFNKKGYLVSHSAITRLVTDDTMSKLKEQLTDALSKENYEEAARIQKLINSKREGDEQKPTL